MAGIEVIKIVSYYMRSRNLQKKSMEDMNSLSEMIVLVSLY